jgi:uncharacterized protein (TIGR03083 family)
VSEDAVGQERIADDVVRERHAFAETIETVGGEAKTLCTPWTAADLAAHLASLDRWKGLPTFVGRWLVASFGLRLNAPAVRFPALATAAFARERRRGLSWALGRLRATPPGLLLRRSVSAVGLFEVWVHHQDVLRANSADLAPTRPDLSVVIPWLLNYHRRGLRKIRLTLVGDDGNEWVAGRGAAVTLRGPLPELVLWLAGRQHIAQVDVTGDTTALAGATAPFRV